MIIFFIKSKNLILIKIIENIFKIKVLGFVYIIDV